VFHRQVLLGAALGQSGGTPDDPRLLDHLVAGELLAGQVDLGSVWQEIPVVHPLTAAGGPEHLGDQQLASQQVVDGQGGGTALSAGRVGRGPVIRINGITSVERLGRAYRGLQIVSDYIGHAHDPATARGALPVQLAPGTSRGMCGRLT
jgi:hypothetical protein